MPSPSPSPSSLTVAALQSDTVWENPHENFKRLRPRIAAAAHAGARLVVLPEFFACGFSMNTDAIQEPFDGVSSHFLCEQATRHNIWICGSIPELPPQTQLTSTSSKPSNTLVLSSPDGTLFRYRKIHPFTFAKEDEHYCAGQDFVTVNIEGVRTTLFVCYDLRFADEFWKTAPQTDLYLVVANWPQRRREHWKILLRARAIENQAYIVGVNRVGQANGLEYRGDSAIIDPWGEALVEATRDQATLIAQVDPAQVHHARSVFPVLPDRR